jgi:3-hydroxybutyryl-CoA dehydrogenase
MVLQITTPYSIRIAVLGAGTMGSGIALSALHADFPISLYDVSNEMLEKAKQYIEHHLTRKGKKSNLRSLTLTKKLEEIQGADIIIEAVPENLELKQEIFRELDDLLPPPTILATNTSTLAVTAIASATATPQRVAGMHFFNPAPVMPLVEVVRAAKTSPDTIESLLALSEHLGKTPVVVKDSPGFIVNRVARPFYGEALRLKGEGVATHQQIDLLMRIGGGFRMGPFQLMDLIGIDVNYAAMKSMYEQTFGEPRYRPHQIQVQMVQQKDLGKKTGRGFYEYTDEPVVEMFTPQKATRQNGTVLISDGTWAPGLAELCLSAGYQLTTFPSISTSIDREEIVPYICLVVAGRSEGLQRQLIEIEKSVSEDTIILCQCADTTLAEIAMWADNPEHLVGFDGIFISNGPIATLVASPTGSPQARATAENFMKSIGRAPIWVKDSPGLVIPRIIFMLANEASFVAGDGVAEPDVIDTAMKLGTNYPKGPIAWAKEIGYKRVVDVIDHLHSEFGEERYRTAPMLRYWARVEKVNG